MMPQVPMAAKPAPSGQNSKSSKDKNLKYSQQLAQSVLASHLQEAPTGFIGGTKKDKEALNATMQLQASGGNGLMPSFINSGTASSKSQGPSHHPPRGSSQLAHSSNPLDHG